MIKLDDLLGILSNDVATGGIDANSPGEMVRASLAGQMPDARRRMPMSLAGAPVTPVTREALPPASQPQGVLAGLSGVAKNILPKPTVQSSVAGTQATQPRQMSVQPMASSEPSWGEDFMAGAAGEDLLSGIIGGLWNASSAPQKRAREAQEKAQRQNLTVRALKARNPNMADDEALFVATSGDQDLLRKYLAPPPVVDPLDRTKRELEIEKLRKEVAGDTVATKRLAELERLGIDPNSAEGMIYQANGKLPESAAKEIIGRQQKGKAGPQVARGLENLNKMADTYDEVSLESAIGPWQGADPDQTGLLSAPVANIARGLGEAWNVIRGGKDNLSEIRSNIRGTTEALAAAIKPLIRGPSDGVWTDADQARLVSIVGDLAQASTKEEFKRRLNAVRDRITSNFNIDVPFDANAAPTTADDGLSGLSTDEIRRRLRGGS